MAKNGMVQEDSRAVSDPVKLGLHAGLSFPSINARLLPFTPTETYLSVYASSSHSGVQGRAVGDGSLSSIYTMHTF